MRSAIAVVAIVVVLAASGVAVAQSQRFTDVPPEHEHYEAVEWAAGAGLTAGYGDGTFRPDEPLAKWRALVFMGSYYDNVLGADESEDFTSGDMMMLLHAMQGEPVPNADTPAVSADAVELSGRGSATTGPVTLGEGVWDITIEVTDNADRPFGVDSIHDRYSHFIDDWTTQRIERLDSPWTDDAATWHRVGIVSDTDTCCFNTVHRYGKRTRFEVTAEPGAAWSIALARRPWPPTPDDYSRVAYVEAHDNETAATLVGFWRRAQDWYWSNDMAVDEVLTDNGPNFVSDAFAELLAERRILHRRTRPYRPQTNGKAERFNRTLADEFLYNYKFRSENERRIRLKRWTHNYNCHRHHTAVGGPPASRAHNLTRTDT